MRVRLLAEEKFYRTYPETLDRLAKDAGIDLSAIAGTGPHGRVIKKDVEAAVSGVTAAFARHDEPGTLEFFSAQDQILRAVAAEGLAIVRVTGELPVTRPWKIASANADVA